MSHPQPGPSEPLTVQPAVPWRLILFVSLGSLLVLVLAGGWVFWQFTGQDMTGLEGIWRDPVNPRHTYRFRPDGDMDTWWGSLPMGRFMSWRRDGQQITVRTTRGWDFVGQLDGGTIRGKMIIRGPDGAVVGETPMVWRKE
jgi:hypothetical protein